MFDFIPEDWKSLSVDELRVLAAQIRTTVQALPKDASSEDKAAALAAVATRGEVITEINLQVGLAAASAGMSEDDEVAPVEEDEDADDEADETDVDDEDADADDADADAAAKVPALAAAGKGGTATNLGAAPDPGAPAPTGRGADKLHAFGGVGDRKGGDQFNDWSELTMALIEAAGTISPTSNQKVKVAYSKGNFAESQILGENMVDNLRRLSSDEIMAAFCAPATPVYDMHCWNTDRRPVRGSLPQFRPDARGSVSIFPSPSLSDITDQDGGTGIWTSDDDDSQTGTDPTVKECAVIECGTPTVYQLYGVWRCLTIQNLLAMTFPELVEAWLNRLAAAHARLAEVQLLEAMATETTAVTGKELGYGAAITVASQVLELLALHQEQERWDGDQMEGWLPRWVRYALKMDLMRRRNTTGTVRVPSDGEVDQLFRDVGVNPHWFIDRPTWAAAVPAPVTGGNLGSVPDTIDILLAPRGKFAVMDRGELNIGVTGNNIYRDNTSNAHNQFTMFFENFEGIVNTDSCPAYLLEIPNLCYNGVQIDDLVLACDGTNPGT